MNEYLKGFIVFMIYAFIIGLIVWVMWTITKAIGKGFEEIGAFVGLLIGVAISIYLWYKVGINFIYGKDSGDKSIEMQEL